MDSTLIRFSMFGWVCWRCVWRSILCGRNYSLPDGTIWMGVSPGWFRFTGREIIALTRGVREELHEGESRLNFNLIIFFICPRFTWLWLRRCSICGPARKSQHNPHRRSSECAVVGRKNQRLKSNIAGQITLSCIFLAGHPGRTGRRWFGRCHKQGHARPGSEAAGDSPEWNQRIRQRLFAAQNKSLPEQSHARRFNESDAIIVRVLFLFDALLLLSSVSLAATKNKNLAEKFFVINSQLFFLVRSKGRWGGVTPETKKQRAADEKM